MIFPFRWQRRLLKNGGKKSALLYSLSPLLPRVGFTALSKERAVIETKGSKVPPEDTLLSELEQFKGLFFHF